MIFLGILNKKIKNIIEKNKLVHSIKINKDKIYKKIKKNCNLKKIKRIEMDRNITFKTKEECINDRKKS